MRFYVSILVVCLVCANSVPSTAGDFARVGTSTFTWDGIFAGGRLSALGGSDMADGGPSALLVNPAPLSGGNALELSYDHADYAADMEFCTFAGAAEWSGWRLNFAANDFFIDDVIVRTAYNPEGSSEAYDYLARVTLAGLSYDLGRNFLNDRSLQWSMGIVWRHYLTKVDDFIEKANSFDLGTTVGWNSRHDNGWSAVTGAVSWQNAKNAVFTFDNREARMNQPLRLGLTMETAFNWSGHKRDLFKLLLAYTYCEQLGDTITANSDHKGLEVVLLDAMAFRWGHSTRVVGDISSWGVGLMLDERILGPFTVHLDWGQMGYDNVVLGDSEPLWGVRVGYNFD